jgi:WD40 repeat protein
MTTESQVLPGDRVGPVGSTVALAPDGRVRATGDVAGRIWLSTAAGDAIWHNWQAHRGAIWVASFSPDGRTLASGGKDGSLKLWDVPSGAERPGPPAGGWPPWDLAFATDGKVLATGSRGGDVCLWDLATAEPAGVLPGQGVILSIAFDPAGTTLATGDDDGQVRIWDLAGREKGSFRLGGAVGALTFAPDARLLAAAGDDRTVLLWDVTAGRPLATLTGFPGLIEALAFPKGGGLLVAGRGWTVCRQYPNRGHSGEGWPSADTAGGTAVPAC